MTDEPPMVLNAHRDGATRDEVGRLLDAAGLASRPAASVVEVRALLDGEGSAGPSLVLLDRGLDGAGDLCRSLVAAGGPGPALVLTGPAGPEADGLDVPADDVLEGPPDADRWVAAVRAWARAGDRLKAERAESAGWRSIFEAVDEGIALLGPDGAIRRANPAMAELLGRPLGGLVGAALIDCCAHLCPPGRPWPFERTLGGGGRAHDEWEAGRRWLRSAAMPLRDGSGAIAGAVVRLADATEDVRLRQRVARAEAEAEDRAGQIDRLERDARLYQSLAGLGDRRDSDARRRPAFSRALPEAFCDAVEVYGRVLDLRLRRRGYRVEGHDDGSADLAALADRLGEAGAGPRDVIELHGLAIRQRCGGAGAARARAYVEEGQLAALELMGRLVDTYRVGRDPAVSGLLGPCASPGTSEQDGDGVR